MKLVTFQSLHNRNFRLFWIGSTISQVGSQMQVVAINWQIYSISHSALSLGLIGLATFIPIFCFALFGGVAADKYDRKRILIASQTLLAMSAFVLCISSFSHVVSLPLIYLILAFNAILTTFNAPARQ